MELELFDGEVNGGESWGKRMAKFVDEGSVESHRYYLARRTVLEMLRDRGFAVPKSEIDLSLQQFWTNYGQKPDQDRLRISTFLRSDPSKKVSFLSSLQLNAPWFDSRRKGKKKEELLGPRCGKRF